LSVPAGQAGVRVSTLELFFDLVFVFTITQLTTVLVDEPTVRGLLQVVLMLGVIWWMYGGYAWLTNAVAPDRTSRRLLLLGGMAAFFVMALSIPHAFDGSGLAFGIAYLAVVVVHAGLFTRASSQSAVRAILGLAPYNIATALLVLAGGIAGGTATYVLWAIAFLCEWLSPRFTAQAGFEVAPGHFVERHGLVVIVAIGESVVAVGIGAAGLPVNLELAGVAVLGLLLSAGLWWTYFGAGDDERAEHALATASPARRPVIALNGFGIWHIPILLGVIATAAGLKKATGHPGDHLHTAQALQLGGGVGLFMVGDIMFRRSLAIGRVRWRATVAILALATVPLGLAVSAVAQLAALVAVMAGALAMERAAGGAAVRMAAPDIARSGYEALRAGRFDELAQILAPDVEWIAFPDAPEDAGCHGRDEVLDTLRTRHAEGDVGELLELIDAGHSVVLCERLDHPERFGFDTSVDRLFQTLTLRDGQVVRIRDFMRRDEALVAAGLPA
jgi:low temperature requirement protein LtrA/ketosteroid isomerase-like protein